MKRNPCQACGACCAFFCVSFPDSETDYFAGGLIPFDMTLPLNKLYRFMKGTKTKSPRCIALEGRIGVTVKCLIYENRSSSCRNFKRSWENDTGNFLCDRARAYFGLQPYSKY